MKEITGLLALVIVVLVYFAPYIYAKSKGHRDAVPILALVLFLGWTGVGWVAAVIWAEMRQLWHYQEPRS